MTTHHPYAEIGSTLPTWEPVRAAENGFPLPASDDTILRWADKNGAPPEVGTRIMMHYNGLGSAVVVGYFSEGQYLGLLVTLDNPTPQGSTLAHAFGTEWRPLVAEERRYTVTLTETVTYTMTVVALDEDAAGALACDAWALSDDPTADYDGIGHGVEIGDISVA